MVKVAGGDKTGSYHNRPNDFQRLPYSPARSIVSGQVLILT